MNTLEMEAKKTVLTRAILSETDEKRINEWMAFFDRKNGVDGKQSACSQSTARRAGCMKGTFTWMSDDFNAPLSDFKEYR
jgi:hypothetical protein